MKVVILAGGLGTRLAEETVSVPKPMVQIGSQPILWHIMKFYASYGFKEFIVALGYKGEAVKSYFLHYDDFNGDLTIDLGAGRVEKVRRHEEDWRVHLIDTGIETMTGGRIRRLQHILGDEPFMLTYGDGLSNVDLTALVAFHRERKGLATITAVRPPARFGNIAFDNKNRVLSFSEKRQADEGWVNGGFMVMEPGIFAHLKSDKDVLELDLLETLATKDALRAFRHDGFWQCMDTMRDRQYLERVWAEQECPWKRW
jgi:glucose-1-phosphate cytidylyltransferase